MKAERERAKTQMKDLELQLSEMHDELDQAKEAGVTGGDRDALLKVNEAPPAASSQAEMLLCVPQDVAQLRGHCQDMLQQKEEQEEQLRQREKELDSLKGALKEEVETHDQYMAALKEEYEKELQKLLAEFDLFKEVGGAKKKKKANPASPQVIGVFCLPGPRSAGPRQGPSRGGETLNELPVEGSAAAEGSAEGEGAGPEPESGPAESGRPGAQNHREAFGAAGKAAGGETRWMRRHDTCGS